MLWFIGALFLVFWVIALALKVTTGLIHLALVAARGIRLHLRVFDACDRILRDDVVRDRANPHLFVVANLPFAVTDGTRTVITTTHVLVPLVRSKVVRVNNTKSPTVLSFSVTDRANDPLTLLRHLSTPFVSW